MTFSPPMSIMITLNTCSAPVFAAMLPNPTLVKDDTIKYKDAIQRSPDFMRILVLFPLTGPYFMLSILRTQLLLLFSSIIAIQFHRQANQCDIKVKRAISKNNTATPYSEQRSSFRAIRNKRSNLALFKRPINVGV